MQKIEIIHRTEYRYARPVRFGEHQAMFRPRDSHDLRLISTGLSITPTAQVRWMHDVFSNSIAVATFGDVTADRLMFENRIRLEHFGLDHPAFPIADCARLYPFRYPIDQYTDLARTIDRHYPDPKLRILGWAESQIRMLGRPCDTQALLEAINHAIASQFTYEERCDPGTQAPLVTLDRGRGSCRDFALFMMEAVRSLGFAARFVTGYLYDPTAYGGAWDPAAAGGGGAWRTGVRGGGATHAWVQVFLPGAGWVEFDPTNGLIGGAGLIRVGVARDPAQAMPLRGSYLGDQQDYCGMDVAVTVRPL